MKSLFAHDHIFLNDGNVFYSKSGFPESVLCRYADAFDKVDVLCRSQKVDRTNLDPILDQRIRFHPQKNLRSLTGLIDYQQVRRKVRHLVKSANVIVARLPSTLGCMAAREARILGIPYVVEVVGNAYEANMLHGSRLGRWVAPFDNWLVAREVLLAKNVIYITERYLQGIYPTRGSVFICPNVQVNRIPEKMLNERLTRFRGGYKRKIGLIGSLDVNYKGHRVALEVLKLLKENHGILNIELEFLGGGDQTRWRNISQELGVVENVSFKGSIAPGKMVMQWLDTIDFMLQPSSTEGQGRSIIEGMSRGCPVVASSVGGIPELLDATMLTNPDDVVGLAQRCAELLKLNNHYALQVIRNWEFAQRFQADLIESNRRKIFMELRSDAEFIIKV